MNIQSKIDYENSIHKLGKFFMIIGTILIVSVPFLISWFIGANPSLDMIIKPLISVLSIYVPVAIIEAITYIPMLGAGGSYLGFITGNVTSMKVPVVLNALSSSNVSPNTEEGDVLSILAVGTSALVTNVVLLLGIVLFVTTDLSKVLAAPLLAPAFDNILAALFGALGVVFVAKNFLLSLAPLILMIVIFIVAPTAPVSILIPVGAIVAIIAGRIMYVKGVIR